MTKEDIERKCLEYSQAATPSYTNGTFDRYAIAQAFEDGAEWRINSVWHDMKKEVPQVYGEYENEVAPSIPCLVRGYLSTGYGYGVRYWNVSYEVWDDEECDDYECDKDKIEEWAYLDDLLPERKEETE
jgi:hypothetical protein